MYFLSSGVKGLSCWFQFPWAQVSELSDHSTVLGDMYPPTPPLDLTITLPRPNPNPKRNSGKDGHIPRNLDWSKYSQTSLFRTWTIRNFLYFEVELIPLHLTISWCQLGYFKTLLFQTYFHISWDFKIVGFDRNQQKPDHYKFCLLLRLPLHNFSRPNDHFYCHCSCHVGSNPSHSPIWKPNSSSHLMTAARFVCPNGGRSNGFPLTVHF